MKKEKVEELLKKIKERHHLIAVQLQLLDLDIEVLQGKLQNLSEAKK